MNQGELLEEFYVSEQAAREAEGAERLGLRQLWESILERAAGG